MSSGAPAAALDGVASRTWSATLGAVLGLAGGAVLLLVALGSLVLAAVNLGAPEPAVQVHPEFYVGDVGLALLYGPLGAFVVVRTRRAIGWAFLAVGLGYGVTALGLQYAALGAHHPGVPGHAVAVQLVVSGWVVGALTSLLVVPWLVAPAGPRLRAVALGVGVALATSAGVNRFLVQLEGGPPNPVTGGSEWSGTAARVDDAVIPLYFLAAGITATHLLVQALRADREQRRGLLWMVVSVVLLAVAYVAFEVGLSLHWELLSLAAFTVFAAQVMLPAAVFVLVLRETSWGFDLAVSRAVVGALLTAMVLGGYVVTVSLLGAWLPWSRESTNLAAVALVALAVTPLRDWVHRRVERLVFGSGADAGVLLDRMGHEIGAGSQDGGLLEGVAEGLRRSLRLRGVVVRSATDEELIVVAGRTDGVTVSVPLRSHGQRVGELLIIPPAGERLDSRTVRLVHQLAGLVAVSLELTTVVGELASARNRLVDVRTEERRLLRRELHDGLGPTLSGIALALAAIENTSTLEPSDAQLLGRLQSELNSRADDVRQMARVLLPPALDDGRLRDALEVLAQRFSDGRFTVSVSGPQADRVDSPRQVAIYHIAAEGVLNAHRHAGARSCEVKVVWLGGPGVLLTITDDGHGVGAGSSPGVGLRSMRERAEELGGTLHLDSSARGTTVSVRLP